MAEAYVLTSCPSGFVLKSELSHKPESQYSFVPKLSHHRGKTIALRAKKQLLPYCIRYNGSTMALAVFLVTQSVTRFFLTKALMSARTWSVVGWEMA